MQLEIPPGPFSGYIFDLDGTLIDSMPVHLRSWEAALRAVGFVGDFDADHFYSLGGVPTLRVAELMAAHYGLVFDYYHVEEEKERRYLELLAGVKLVQPVVDFLQSTAVHFPHAIATGGGPEIAHPALAMTGLAQYFDVVVTPADVAPGRGKPHPDMFLRAAELLGVDPAQCLVFEDAAPGIAAAQAAGMSVVHVPSR